MKYDLKYSQKCVNIIICIVYIELWEIADWISGMEINLGGILKWLKMQITQQAHQVQVILRTIQTRIRHRTIVLPMHPMNQTHQTHLMLLNSSN